MRIKITLSLLCVVLFANAHKITVDEAAILAQEFLKSGEGARKVTSHTRDGIQLTHVKSQIEYPFYAFNRDNNGGFVIVSADEQSNMVLGYSDKGSFDFSNIPPQLKALLKTGTATHKVQAQTRAAAGQVLYETAEWGQNAPFNALCPTVDGVTPPAGCVATAMAIVMKYHNWPDYTRGGIQSNYFNQEQQFDFSNYIIDWNALNEPGTDKFNQEAAKLTYSAGVAAGMIYGVDESAAVVWPISHKMMENYTYAPECQFIERSVFDDEKWNSILMEQLNEVGPVVYSGNGDVGHCFVIDGYDEKGYYHVNWGWDGYLNGYYALDFSDVGGMAFSDDQGMIINIKPDHERRVYSKSWMPNADVYVDGYFIRHNDWNFTSSDINPGERISVSAPFLTLNEHIGYYKIAVVDENGKIEELIGEDYCISNGIDHSCQYPGIQMQFHNMEFPELKEGQRYQLVSMEAEYAPDKENLLIPSQPSNDPMDWKIVLGGIIHPTFFYDKGNTSDMVSFYFHIDEKIPVLFPDKFGIYDFTINTMRGSDCQSYIVGPSSGIYLDIKCSDKDGTPIAPVYVEYQTGSEYTFSISAFEDNYDVWVKYEEQDSRKDADISLDAIIEEGGLIYKIENEGCLLIGYDKTIPEIITIPDYVSFGGKKYTVTSISADALLFAPVKEIIINATHLETIGCTAFGGIENLSSLSIKDMSGLNSVTWYPFLKSNLRNVYLDKNLTITGLEALLSIQHWGIQGPQIERDNLDFYLSQLLEDDNFSNYMTAIYHLQRLSSEYNKLYNSFNIPGIGNNIYLASEFENVNIPITQMWNYEIDKTNNLVKISSVIDNVVIDKVEINGTEAEKNEAELYAVTNTTDEGIDVVVNYTINGSKQMTTHYTPAYNAGVESSTLIETGIEDISNNISDKRFNVYNMQGICIKVGASQNDIKQLKPGVYVIDNKKIYLK